MITKIEVYKSSVGNKKGWAFSVEWDQRGYPNFISALYKTKKEATLKSIEYRNTGKFEFYGTAE